MPHARRPEVSSERALEVTLRVAAEVGSLRERKRAAAVREGLAAAAPGDAFRVAGFSIRAHEIRLTVEAEDREALSRGVKGLEVRVARRLNALLGRKGTVFADRYDTRPLGARSGAK